MKENNALLRLDGVGFKTDDAVILHNINFQLRAGEFKLITGPSGCGKSTLLKIIASLLSPTSGRLFFDDADVGLALQKIDGPVNIVEETTDDTDADGIADIVESRIGRLRRALAVTFFPHTPFGLDAVNQVFISRFPGLGLYIVTIGADTADNIFQSSLQSRSIGTIDRIHSSITSFYKLSGMYEYYSTQKALSHEDSAFLL